MALDQRKHEKKHDDLLRDTRTASARVYDWLSEGKNAAIVFFLAAAALFMFEPVLLYLDFLLIVMGLYYWWVMTRDRSLIFKMPYGSKWKDKNNEGPGRSGKAEGILYVGNGKKTDEELWFTNSDARTHILYLGTTGAGKTEGLKSMVSNAMCWASGFVYIDGKADTDLWSSLSALLRRFGRDDDLLVLNYMTGNSDARAPSNTMNPFSSGSASYLVNMLVSLMPESGGDNAMWKERAVSLLSALMPVLTWRRDNLEIPMSVTSIREYMTLDKIIMLSRSEVIPEHMRHGLTSYLDELPGYIEDAFDDQGKEKPPGPNQQAYDTTTPRQQHGYLSMQFTRSLQSLGDDYGYIFESQAADVDMVDVVLNRRVLVVLIPALEKSGDETANLGKIVAASMKGMMGSALGATVEGESANVIENKPTHSSTPFMTVFDEVGYYTAEGMAVMAAQARSLGFSLIFSAQDLPALEKRVKEEARSITANCNLKIFGKLEDPTQTKEFFEKTVGEALVVETSGFKDSGQSFGASYLDQGQASIQTRSRASYSGLKEYKEGEALVCFGKDLIDGRIFYSNPGHAKAMRVTRFIGLPPPDENLMKNAEVIGQIRDKMVHKSWTALKADVAVETPEAVTVMDDVFRTVIEAGRSGVDAAIAAIAGVHVLEDPLALEKRAAAAGSFGPDKPSFAPGEGADLNDPLVKFAQKQADKIKAKDGDSPVPPSDNVSAPPPQTPPVAPVKAPPLPGDGAPDKTAAPAEGNPMGFFAAKKKDGAPSVPSSTSTPSSAPAPAPEDKVPADNVAETPSESVSAPISQDASAEPVKAPGGVKWDDLMKEAGAADAPIVSVSDSAPVVRAALDPTVADILQKAGERARESLFEGTDDET